MDVATATAAADSIPCCRTVIHGLEERPPPCHRVLHSSACPRRNGAVCDRDCGSASTSGVLTYDTQRSQGSAAKRHHHDLARAEPITTNTPGTNHQLVIPSPSSSSSSSFFFFFPLPREIIYTTTSQLCYFVVVTFQGYSSLITYIYIYTFIQVVYTGKISFLSLLFSSFFSTRTHPCPPSVHFDNMGKREEGIGTTRKVAVDTTEVTPTGLDSVKRRNRARDPALLRAFTSEGRNPLNESVHGILPATRRGSYVHECAAL